MTVTGLTAGTTYNFKVAAINLAGSTFSSVFSITPGTPGSPNAPTTAYNPNSNKIQVSLTSPTTIWSPITSYRVRILCKNNQLEEVTTNCAESAA